MGHRHTLGCFPLGIFNHHSQFTRTYLTERKFCCFKTLAKCTSQYKVGQFQNVKLYKKKKNENKNFFFYISYFILKFESLHEGGYIYLSSGEALKKSRSFLRKISVFGILFVIA